VPAHRDRNVAVVESIERGDVALARHAERVAHAMDDELINQDFGGRPRAVVGAHGHLRIIWLPL
jgi:hypothetical protein